MSIEIKSIPPGAYQLGHSVVNPRADRRCPHDWRKWQIWAEGLRFVVRAQYRMGALRLEELMRGLTADGALTSEEIERIRAGLVRKDWYTVVELAGDRHPALRRIGPNEEDQYAALAAALVRTSESLEQFMTRIDCQDDFVRWLAETGAVPRDGLERWWYYYQHGAELPPGAQLLPLSSAAHSAALESATRQGVTPPIVPQPPLPGATYAAQFPVHDEAPSSMPLPIGDPAFKMLALPIEGTHGPAWGEATRPDAED